MPSDKPSVWEILVPRKYNDGRPVRIRHHRVWDSKVRAIAGGLTILVPTIKGEWVSPDGKIFVDSTIPVRIACTQEQIEKIMDITAKHYDQEAVIAYEISTNVLVRDYK